MELIDPRLVLEKLADRLKYLSNGSERRDGRMNATEFAKYTEIERCIEVINNVPTILAVPVARCTESVDRTRQ